MTTNGRGPLTTAEACQVLQCEPIQLRRWRNVGFLIATKDPSRGGTGRLLWSRSHVNALARKLPPKRPGHTRRIKLPS